MKITKCQKSQIIFFPNLKGTKNESRERNELLNYYYDTTQPQNDIALICCHVEN